MVVIVEFLCVERKGGDVCGVKGWCCKDREYMGEVYWCEFEV